MGNNTTTRGARATAVVWLLVAGTGCTGSTDPDPRVIATRLGSFAPAGGSAAQAAAPVVATLAPSLAPSAPPAPLAESRRLPTPAAQPLTIAVGPQALAALDVQVLRTFTAAHGSVEVAAVAGTDRDAVEKVSLGHAEFAVIGGQLSPRDLQRGLCQTRLGVELFALAVAPESPVRSLTHHQVRQIFTGQVTSWNRLGYDGGAIVAVVPSDRALAQRAQKALIPGDTFASTCVAVGSEKHVVDQLLQNPGAIGIVPMNARPRESGQRLLQIDWCTPTLDAFGYGTYPFGLPVTLVTSGQPVGVAKNFLAFTRADGRELLGHTLLVTP